MNNPHFPALWSSHELSQRHSPQKQFPRNHVRVALGHPVADLFAAFLLPTLGQVPETKADEKKQPHVRFICSSALAENQKVIPAARNEEGKWQEFGPVNLRSSFITDWIPAKPGELHLTLREGETLKSIGLKVFSLPMFGELD